jgi:tRNA(adenine34) deaminase
MTTPDTDDEAWMDRALALADDAAAEGEVPVGAVVVREGSLVASAWNRPIAARDPTAHAEILALRAAAQVEEAYRLPDTTLYVTLEPCPMCVGAIVHARVARIVFGAADPKTGACGGAMDLIHDPSHNHHPEVTGGVRAEAGGERLRQFFRQRRRAASSDPERG